MTATAQRVTRNRHRVRSFFLYAVVSIAIAFAFSKISSVVADRWGHDAYMTWGGLAIFTLGLFALFLGDSEKLLRRPRFWIVAAILLVAHMAAFTVVLTHVEEWRLMWFMVMVIEYPFFLLLRDNFVNSR